MFSRSLNFLTNRIYELPILVMMPHSRCNCRCVMCDIWKANNDKKELTVEEIERHLPAFGKLKVKEIVLSGGEALMHNNLWVLCDLLKKKSKGVKITLLSTGLLLKKFSKEIIDHVDEVIVSLEGSKEVHNRIRNIPEAFEKLAEGVKSIKDLEPSFRITGRCVLQKMNYFDLDNIITSAKEIGLDQISFLPADISTTAFNHLGTLQGNDISLTLIEAKEFQQIVEKTIENFDPKFVAESPDKMRRIPGYYMALLGRDTFESPPCNAPWVSAVLESDGRLMPCFFHREYGNVSGKDFEKVLNSEKAIAFRKNLKVKENDVCKRCVCSLKMRAI